MIKRFFYSLSLVALMKCSSEVQPSVLEAAPQRNTSSKKLTTGLKWRQTLLPSNKCSVMETSLMCSKAT